MKLVKDLGDGYQIVQFGTWQAWDKNGNYSSGLADELEQEIGQVLSALMPSGGSTNE